MSKKFEQASVAKKVDQLLRKMTLAQKIGQMLVTERETSTPADVKKYHLGAVMSGAGSVPDNNDVEGWLAMVDEYWLASTEPVPGQVSIPTMYGVDAVHGHNNLRTATIFPHNVGLGAGDDLSLVSQIAQATRNEVLATGVDWVFAPNLAVAQDPRWGRFYESYHRNPDKVSGYAEQMVKGFQGNLNGEGVIACVKHWVGDGATQLGIDQGDAKVSWDTLLSTHIKPYRAAIDAGAMSVMVSFSSWNGDKCHSHSFLLSEVLKQQLGFEGFVVSDMNGIDYLTDDFYLAVEQAVNAGIDMFMLPDNWLQFITCLQSHVEMGTVSMSRVNDAVRRILSVKVASGLFDLPKPSERKLANNPSVACAEHLELAATAAANSVIYHKNEDCLLPLNANSRILVTGKNAHDIGHLCGGFTQTWQGFSGNEDFPCGQSIWQGIQAHCPNASYLTPEQLGDIKPSDKLSDEYDLALVVIGETPYAEGRGDIHTSEYSFFDASSDIIGQINLSLPYGQSLHLKELHPEDGQLIGQLAHFDIPVVTVLVTGRPLIVTEELNMSSAFATCWLPGNQGQGVSEVLCGKRPQVGSLPCNWPQTL